MGEMRIAYKISIEKPEGKRPLGRSKHRWEDNTKMGLRDIGMDVINWIHVVEGRGRRRALVNMVMNFRGSIKGGEFL
jgi:hypothetical protein